VKYLAVGGSGRGLLLPQVLFTLSRGLSPRTQILVFLNPPAPQRLPDPRSLLLLLLRRRPVAGSSLRLFLAESVDALARVLRGRPQLLVLVDSLAGPCLTQSLLIGSKFVKIPAFRPASLDLLAPENL